MRSARLRTAFNRPVSKTASIKRPKLSRALAHRRFVRVGLVTLNIAVLAIVAAVVLVNPKSGHTEHTKADAVDTSSLIANPLDQFASANIALTAARMSGLGEVIPITNQADSQAAELSMSAASETVVAKPQVVTTAFKSNKDIIDHVTESGDTISTLAAKYGVTSDSIRWSNGLTGDALAVGTKIVIPPVNGIVYTVGASDTAANLASKFSTSEEKIIAFNNAEISGLKVGERIVIPGAIKATAIAVRLSNSYPWGGSAIYGFNGYDPGYCTWYVANKRIAIGKPLPANLGDAYTWDDNGIRAGLQVDRTPAYGAAVVTKTYRAPGHVAFVEEVFADGSVRISEMNAQYVRYQITSRIMSPDEANSYNYVH